MATASAARTIVAGKGPYSQFRLSEFDKPPTFNDDALQTNAIDGQHLPAPYNPDAEQMAQASRPSSGQNIDRTSSVAPPRPTPQAHNQSTSSPAGALGALELVELSSNPIVEGILGPNKDGRVRNPVPSKLKGKTDQKQGNFGVMHMGMSPGKKTEAQGKDAAAERDAAARRTSENTASRAKAAQSEKYVPPKKRGMELSLGEAGAKRASPFGMARDDSRQRAQRPLAPDETKFEQARLLTLLRSINPVTVVDQICKAVAYFGGIPGAPPPEDGIFPESANTRETGALFIGWLAEIFPDLSGAVRSPEVSKDNAQATTKKRNRASRSTKPIPAAENEGASSEEPNSRNGYGYGPAVSAPAWGLPSSLGLVNTPIPQAPPMLLDDKPAQMSVADAIKAFEQGSPSTPPRDLSVENTATAAVEIAASAVAAAAAAAAAAAESASNKRRRGRPKGSRNKGKDGQQGSESIGANNGQQEDQQQAQQAPHSPEVQVTAAKVLPPNQAPPVQAVYPPISNNQPVIQEPAQNNQYPEQPWQTNPHQNQFGHSSNLAPADELSPEERAVLEAFRNPGSETAASVVPSPNAQTQSVPAAGQKRKRPPPKPKAIASPASFQPPPLQPVQNANDSAANSNTNKNNDTAYNNVTPKNDNIPIEMAKEALQWTSIPSVDAPTSTPSAPPPKRPRQRKPKVPTMADPPSRNQTASVVSSATPPIPPSTIPDSQASSTQQSMQAQQSIQSQQSMQPQQSAPVSRPPAEGLDAHYESFARLQQQQNGRSHTPTLPQQHVQQQVQQQVRQHSKPASVVPQQHTSQMQQQQTQQQKVQQTNYQTTQQQQMQRQKSQQNSTQINQQSVQQNSHHSLQQGLQQSAQRDEQKSTQATASRPTSATFYNQAQRSQTSPGYSQQYPSHQPSQQLYGAHQNSPQLSNNSYRSTSSHTLAQASPQFSSADNSYRTASPHTLAQPSPSFSQADTSNFRSSSAHGLAQPSSSYPTQTENTYRTPGTHSMTQPSTSYTTSRSHTQAHQPSHQSHYSSFSDSSYIDLPTLDSLGHSVSSSNPPGSLASYTQGLIGNSRSSGGGGSSLYGSSTGLSGNYDTDLLRGISSSTVGSHSVGAYSSGMGSAFDTATSEREIRERLLRGLGHQGRR